MLQDLGSLGGAFAAALLGAAALAAAHLRPSSTRPAAPAQAAAAPSSEQGAPGKAGSPSGAVAVTASPAVSRRATPFPPLLAAGTREEEIRMLKQKAAVAEESERRWSAQGKDQLAQLSRDTLHRCLHMIRLLEQEVAQFEAVVGSK